MAEAGIVIACHNPDQWKEQLDNHKASNKLLVVDFTASWCPPCRMIAPIFAEFAQKFTDVMLMKVDVDEVKSVTQEYEVYAMPTFVFFKDGQEIDRIVGADRIGIEKKILEYSAA